MEKRKLESQQIVIPLQLSDLTTTITQQEEEEEKMIQLLIYYTARKCIEDMTHKVITDMIWGYEGAADICPPLIEVFDPQCEPHLDEVLNQESIHCS